MNIPRGSLAGSRPPDPPGRPPDRQDIRTDSRRPEGGGRDRSPASKSAAHTLPPEHACSCPLEGKAGVFWDAAGRRSRNGLSPAGCRDHHVHRRAERRYSRAPHQVFLWIVHPARRLSLYGKSESARKKQCPDFLV